MKILENRCHHKIRAVCICMIAWLILGAGRTNAAEQNVVEQECSLSLPVSVRNTKGVVVIESGEKGTPMPEQTELQIGMNETKAFGEIRYNRPEDYHYQIYQKPGQQDSVIYDDTVYDVTVRVIRGADGAFTADVWCQSEGKEEKIDKIIFSNTLRNETDEREPVKTPEIKTSGIITTKHKTVKTADVAPVGILVALAGLSAGTMTAIARWKKKSEE